MTQPMVRPAARAVADAAGGIVLASVEIAAPPERVFEALTRADEVMRWWGSAETYRTTRWEAELRVGGTWRAWGQSADGSPFTVGGRYLAVEPPRLIVHTWEPSWHPGEPTTVTIRLAPTATGTRVTLRHDGFGDRAEMCERHGQGWQLVLGWLAAHASPPGEPRYFVCRLLGPRPTFPADMTPDESELMQAHAAYWRGQLREGRAVVFGPVLDPAGVWGLGVVRARDDAEVRAFEAGDPVIASGKGFRYEILPMMTAVTRD